MKTALAIFFVSFALYLHTAGPGLVPFRDAGEMASTVHTLGILHPPSYPAYTLIGHGFDQLPLGNPAYRLNVLSGLMLSLAWVFLYFAMAALGGSLPALAAVVLGAVSYQFWVHALVTEMYTLNILLLAMIVWALVREHWVLAAALFGVGLANRLDLVLCAPALLFFLQPAYEKNKLSVSIGVRCAAAGLGGLLIYAYLPFRALQQPLFNWNNPSTLDAFWGTLTRRGYGSGLDILSQSYRAGENFISELSLYGRHLIVDFAGVGVLLAIAGFVYLWKEKRFAFYATALGFAVTGPLFIYLGNLPPNPHAVAIMESGYLMPDVFFLIAVAAGVALLLRKSWGTIVIGLVAVAAVAQAAFLYPDVNHRDNYVAIDFMRHARQTLPPRAMVIARSDVPLFTLFYGRWVESTRTDWIPLALALTNSPWYVAQVHHQASDLWMGPLHTLQDWETFAHLNPSRPIYGTFDAEWPSVDIVHASGRGLLLGWNETGVTPPYLEDLYSYRGRYRYDAYRDFFTPELIEEYAKAWFEAGRKAERDKNLPAAEDDYRRALCVKPTFAYASLQLGFLEATQEHWPEADRWYAWAVDSFAGMVKETRDWKTLPEPRHAIELDFAQALVHRGVSQERLGHPDVSESLYNQALAIDPANADALYDRAVLYWGKNWQRVVTDLETMARVAPQDARWKTYLPPAMQKLRTNR